MIRRVATFTLLQVVGLVDDLAFGVREFKRVYRERRV